MSRGATERCPSRLPIPFHVALGPTVLSAITAAVPTLSALAARSLLGEPLGAGGLAGVGLVTAAMFLSVAQARGAAESATGRRSPAATRRIHPARRGQGPEDLPW